MVVLIVAKIGTQFPSLMALAPETVAAEVVVVETVEEIVTC